MAIIYRATDRKKVKIEDITFQLAPLTFAQRGKVEALISTGSYDKIMEATVYMFRCSIKDVKGIKYSDKSAFKLVIEDDMASESQIEELLSMPYWSTIMSVLMNNISNFNTVSVDVDMNGEDRTAKKIEADTP